MRNIRSFLSRILHDKVARLFPRQPPEPTRQHRNAVHGFRGGANQYSLTELLGKCVKRGMDDRCLSISQINMTVTNNPVTYQNSAFPQRITGFVDAICPTNIPKKEDLLFQQTKRDDASTRVNLGGEVGSDTGNMKTAAALTVIPPPTRRLTGGTEHSSLTP